MQFIEWNENVIWFINLRLLVEFIIEEQAMNVDGVQEMTVENMDVEKVETNANDAYGKAKEAFVDKTEKMDVDKTDTRKGN